jgi:hypothetical protein
MQLQAKFERLSHELRIIIWSDTDPFIAPIEIAVEECLSCTLYVSHAFRKDEVLQMNSLIAKSCQLSATLTGAPYRPLGSCPYASDSLIPYTSGLSDSSLAATSLLLMDADKSHLLGAQEFVERHAKAR